MKSTGWVVLTGTILRLVFAPFTGHPYDLPIWLESGELISKGISPYSPTNHLGQTILWAIWTGLAYVISSPFTYLNPYLYILIIKLLPIFADIYSSYLILRTLEEETHKLETSKLQRYTLILYFNPVWIFGSAFWAMADSLSLVCLLLSYHALKRNLTYHSVLIFSIGVALKLYPIVLLPPILLYIIFFQGGMKPAIKYSTILVSLFIIIAYLPFILFPWNSHEITGVLFDQTQRSFGGMGTFGFFAISLESTVLHDTFSPINAKLNQYYILRLLWVFSSIIFTLMILFKYYRSSKQISNNQFEVYISLTIMYYCVWILGATWVSEQNFIPLLGYLYLYWFSKVENNSDNIIFLNWFIIGITGVVTLHIMFNVPIIMFFYLVYDNADHIYQNSVFMEIRANMLSSLIVVSTLLLIILLYLTWKTFSKENFKSILTNV